MVKSTYKSPFSLGKPWCGMPGEGGAGAREAASSFEKKSPPISTVDSGIFTVGKDDSTTGIRSIKTPHDHTFSLDREDLPWSRHAAHLHLNLAAWTHAQTLMRHTGNDSYEARPAHPLFSVVCSTAAQQHTTLHCTAPYRTIEVCDVGREADKGVFEGDGHLIAQVVALAREQPGR